LLDGSPSLKWLLFTVIALVNSPCLILQSFGDAINSPLSREQERKPWVEDRLYLTAGMNITQKRQGEET
jgi:hypothetical protein